MLHAERRSVEMGAWVAPALRVTAENAKVITLGEYADTWLEHRNVKPRTRSMYRDLLRLHIEPGLGRIALNNITPETIRTWYASLGTEHTRRNSHAYGLVHAVCATAVTDGPDRRQSLQPEAGDESCPAA